MPRLQKLCRLQAPTHIRENVNFDALNYAAVSHVLVTHSKIKDSSAIRVQMMMCALTPDVRHSCCTVATVCIRMVYIDVPTLQ